MIETPDRVIAPINAERDFANTKYGLKARPVGEHILIIEKYFKDTKAAWLNNKGDNAALHELRKVAAVTLQCLVEHGCPWRGEKVVNGVNQEDLPQKPIISDNVARAMLSADLKSGL